MALDFLSMLSSDKKFRLLYYLPILLALYIPPNWSPLLVGCIIGFFVSFEQAYLNYIGVSKRDNTTNTTVKWVFTVCAVFGFTLTFVLVYLSLINSHPLVAIIQLNPYFLGIVVPLLILVVFLESIFTALLFMTDRSFSL